MYVWECLHLPLKESDQLGNYLLSLFPATGSRFSLLWRSDMDCLQVVHQGTELNICPTSQLDLYTVSKISPITLKKKKYS